MKHSGLVVLFSALTLAGCASNGDEDSNGFDEFTNAAASAGGSVVDGVGSLFSGYETGLKITEEQMNSVKNEQEVVSLFGHPEEKEEYRGTFIYKYPYVHIPHFGTNINEYTIFEMDKNDKVLRAYKSSRKGTGVAAIDSATN